MTEYPGTGDESMEEWETIAAGLRALAPADALAAVEALRAERDVWRKGSEAQAVENARLAAELAAAKQREARLVEAGDALGSWMSAALEDPKPCAAMKRDINSWFAALAEMQAHGAKE